jgi:hypothetical protein
MKFFNWNCIKSKNKFKENVHLCYAEIFSLWTKKYISSFIHIFFDFFPQNFRMLTLQIFFVGSRVWTLGLMFASQVLYHFRYTPRPFGFHSSNSVAFLPGHLQWTVILLFTSHSSWDDRCTPPHPALLVEMGVLLTFGQGWPWTMILLISAWTWSLCLA